MNYTLSFDPLVSSDIQVGVKYYNTKRRNQGKKFKKAVDNHLDTLETNPFFGIRFENVRCLPIKKYPYMIYFSVNESEKTVRIHSILNTFTDNPKLYK